MVMVFQLFHKNNNFSLYTFGNTNYSIYFGGFGCIGNSTTLAHRPPTDQIGLFLNSFLHRPTARGVLRVPFKYFYVIYNIYIYVQTIL